MGRVKTETVLPIRPPATITKMRWRAPVLEILRPWLSLQVMWPKLGSLQNGELDETGETIEPP